MIIDDIHQADRRVPIGAARSRAAGGGSEQLTLYYSILYDIILGYIVISIIIRIYY